MSKKQIAILILIMAVAAFFIIRIIKNAMVSEEAKIKKLIKELAEDFEQKKFKKVFEHIAEDYKDDGEHTKKILQEYAATTLILVSEIKVSISNLLVVVSPDKKHAEAGFTAKVYLQTKLGDENFEEPIIFYLRRESGEWMLYESNLKRYEDEL
jgi:hypothetical protein